MQWTEVERERSNKKYTGPKLFSVQRLKLNWNDAQLNDVTLRETAIHANVLYIRISAHTSTHSVRCMLCKYTTDYTLLHTYIHVMSCCLAVSIGHTLGVFVCLRLCRIVHSSLTLHYVDGVWANMHEYFIEKKKIVLEWASCTAQSRPMHAI